MCDNHSGNLPLAAGAATVKINGLFAGRIGEQIGCSAKVVAPCSPNVLIGGPSAADANVPITPEVPDWATDSLKVMGIAGALLALPFSVATVGVAATIGGGVGGYWGAVALGAGGRKLGQALGVSETGIRSLEVAGQFAGGAVGGGLGAKGVQSFNRRYQISADPNTLGSNGGNIRVTRRPTNIEPGGLYGSAKTRHINCK